MIADDGREGGDVMQLQSAVSFRSAAGDHVVEGYDSAVSNRFRSNIEIVEKPRQMIVLMATIAGASYLVSYITQHSSEPIILVLSPTPARVFSSFFLFFFKISKYCCLLYPAGSSSVRTAIRSSSDAQNSRHTRRNGKTAAFPFMSPVSVEQRLRLVIWLAQHAASSTLL